MTTLRGAWLLALLCLQASPAAADLNDPDLEIARRHFTSATDLYDAGKYAEAIVEFEAARQAHAAPAFDFNIARCHDRLEHRAQAIAAYQRYLAASPHAADAAETRARIRLLEQRVAAPSHSDDQLLLLNLSALDAPQDPAPRSRSVGLLASGVVVAVVGLGLIGGSLGAGLSARSTYDNLSMQCGPGGDRCPDGYTATRDGGKQVEIVSWVLAPVGVVALAAGAALLAIGSRHSERIAVAPAPLPGGGALAIAGSW